MDKLSKKQIWDTFMEQVSEPKYQRDYVCMETPPTFDFGLIKILTKVCNDDERHKLIQFLEKMEINQIFDENKRTNYSIKKTNAIDSIVASFDSDEEKISFIKSIGVKYNRTAKLIASLKSDEKKIQLMQDIGLYYESDYSHIIASLVSDEKKVELLEQTTESSNKAIIISSLSTDEKKLELLDGLEEIDKMRVILSLEGDEKKLELLDKVSSEEYKEVREQLISIHGHLSWAKFSSEKKHAELIEELKFEIICSLSSDDKKMELLPTLGKWGHQARVVEGIKSAEIKTKFLEQLPKKQKYREGRKVIKESINGDKREIENDFLLTESIDPLLEKCKEVEAEGRERNNKKVASQKQTQAEAEITRKNRGVGYQKKRQEVEAKGTEIDNKKVASQKQAQAEAEIARKNREEEYQKKRQELIESISKKQQELAELKEQLKNMEKNIGID